MVSQKAFLHGGLPSFTLLEEQNPPETIDGETKTHNHPANQSQRDVVTYRNVTENYSISVEMPLCVQGWENPEKKQAMSLMVFEYRLVYVQRDCFVKSVKTSFVFDEAASSAEEQESQGPANPSVVAYAPFESPMRWNETDAEVKYQAHGSGKIGINYGAQAELSAGGEREASHTQKFFSRGLATRKFNNTTRKWDEVSWFLQQNESQRDGVPSNFSVAILLKRESNANFKGTFNIRTEAGRWADWKSGYRRFFRMKEDDPVNFDPQESEKGRKWATYKSKISQDDLGQLERDGQLAELVNIWGSDLGAFAPLATS